MTELPYVPEPQLTDEERAELVWRMDNDPDFWRTDVPEPTDEELARYT